jgi:hypothetical protein
MKKVILSKGNNDLLEFDSIQECARAFGVHFSYVSKCINGHIDNIHGYKFKLKE